MRHLTAILFVVSSVASAQQGLDSSALRAPSVRNAGVLHVATGAWTRKASSADLGADIIYNNTCSTATYFALNGFTFVDEGRIPSTTSPSNANSRPGCGVQYVIDGFQIAYCTDRPSVATYEVAFYTPYAPCASVIGVTPTASFALVGLPASPAGGVQCWTVTLDLDAPPQTASLAFTMQADGDGTYVPPDNSNLFGWSMRSTLPAGQQLATGPLFAGDFNTCSGFDGTRWDSVVNYLEHGTGMGTLDLFRMEGPGGTVCHPNVGVPIMSFHLELIADACTDDFGNVFCPGDGSGTQCPCGNNSPPGMGVGCLNSLGIGGRLRASGSPRISADTLTMHLTNLPATTSALLFQGQIQQGGGAGTVFGDGKRCAGGSIARIATRTASGGAVSYPQPGDPSISVRGGVTAPGIRTYQGWYRNAASFCTAATFNLTNGVEIVWVP